MIDTGTLTQQLEAYLGEKWGESVSVSDLKRFHGGAGRETFRFDAKRSRKTESLVLRRDPPKSIIETEREPEYNALEMFAGTEVPVPEPLFLETGDAAFGAPGFIMREVPDGEAGGGFSADPFGEARAAIGRDFFGALGRIHAADPAPLGLDSVTPEERVRHWQEVIAEDALQPEPLAAAAARWLLKNAPPPEERPAVVHGDYRRGNFLVRDGRLVAILDWEMVHVGDPLEDLAWAVDPLFAGDSGLAGTMLPEADAIAIWEEKSGRQFDADRFAWWRLFAAYMGLAIWISSAAEAASGRSTDPVIAWAGLIPYRLHSLSMATMLKEIGPCR